MEQYQEILNICMAKQKEIEQLQNICQTLNNNEDVLYNKIISYHDELDTIKLEYNKTIELYKKIIKNIN